MTPSLSHCLYGVSSSLSVFFIFLFCSLSGFCGAGAALGSRASCARSGGAAIARERNERTVARANRDIETPQCLRDEILTWGKVPVNQRICRNLRHFWALWRRN